MEKDFDTILTVLVGLPASGKSTFAKEKVATDSKYVWISSDNIRIEHDYNISNDKVFSLMWSRTTKAAEQHKHIIYDATNINARRRRALVRDWKTFCKKRGLNNKCDCVLFLHPMEILKERNKRRTGRACVPEEVFKKMLHNFQMPAYFEGWDNITIDESSEGKILPLINIYEMVQDNPHHTLILGEHLIAAQDMAIEHNFNSTVIYAALYHDIGKYWTKFYRDDIAHFYNHENVGAYMLALHFLAYSSLKEYYDIVLLVNYHMRPYAWEKSKKSQERDEKMLGSDFFSNLEKLHICDKEAH